MTPPRLLTALLARLLPETERDAILGDLEESFHHRCDRDGPRAARAWYRREAFAALRMIVSPTAGHELPPSRLFAVGDLLHEIRYALRQLHRRPLYAGIVIFTLAVGIGATSAVLSVANPVLFRPLPYPEPGRVVLVGESGPNGAVDRIGYTTFADLGRGLGALEASAVMSWWTPVLGGEGDPEQLVGQSVTADFFRVLGVAMLHGRDFARGEDAPQQPRTVILGHGLWQRRFGEDPGVVGHLVTLSGTAYTVVGVLPAGFESLLEPAAQVWRPLGYDETLSQACRNCRHLRAVARLRPEVRLAAARAELDGVAARLIAAYPDDYGPEPWRMERLHDQLVADVRPALLMMLGAGLFVLAIACANVGNLMLARGAEREGEFAVRRALGAGAGRLAQQVLVESGVLCVSGAVLGLALAYGGVAAMVAANPAWLPRGDTVRLDWRVALISFAIAIGVTVIVGVGPGLLARGPRTAPGPTRTVAGGRRQRRIGNTLVVAEVSLALMLLVGAGLLTRSLGRMLAVDPGFEAANLLTMNVVASGPRYQDDSTVWRMQQRLLETVAAVPGVAAAAYASQIPLSGSHDQFGWRIEGASLAVTDGQSSADRFAVSPAYTALMRIPLVRGRALGPDDRGAAAPVVLVNETLARLAWPGGEALGRRIQMGGYDSPWRTVVGVVGDVRHESLSEAPAPQLYVPAEQWQWAEGTVALVVRTSGPPSGMTGAVRNAVAAVDPTLAVSGVASAAEHIAARTADRRLVMRLFEAFALVALVLAAAGVYGLLARRVTEQRRELGIRTALGASREQLLVMVLRDGGRLALLGLGLGLAGALALGGLLTRLLFDIAPRDPATLAGAVLLLGGIALLACAVPAWQATRVDPVEVLRAE